MAPKPPPTITLFRGFPETGCYTWSPFVTKLEACLRFANIPYRTEQGSFRKAPRGKVPYASIQDAEQAEPQILPDSTLITKALIEKGYAEDLNERLTPSERLRDLALKSLLEDKLSFYQVSRLIPLKRRDGVDLRTKGLRTVDPKLLRHALQDPRCAALACSGRCGQHHLPQSHAQAPGPGCHVLY